MKRSTLADCFLLLFLTAAIYLRTLGHQFQMSWDDNWYVVYNPSIQGFSWQNLKTVFSSVYQANYAPLQMVSYMLDYSIWGLAPGGFALTNMIFHALNGVLLYRLVLGLHGERLPALVAAALFIAHPLQVESVAWISCRKNVLSLFFFLLAWEGYRRYRTAEPGRGRSAYLASLAAFLLSLMAKSTTLVLPAILVLYDLCFPEAGRRLRLKDKIPYLAAALIFAGLSLHFQQADFQGGIRIPYHGGGPLATFFTMLPVFCLYLWRLVWPAGLSVIYEPPVHVSPDWTVVTCGIVLGAICWGGARLWRYDRRLGFWFLFFWVGLLPFMQIVPIWWLITDRYLNLSIIAPAVLAGVVAGRLHSRWNADRRRLLSVGLAVWLLALAAASFQRVGVWRNSLTLWSDAVSKQPQSIKVWEHYAEALRSAGRLEEASQAYERSLAADPSNTETLAGLGALYTDTGELDRGRGLLERLLKLRPDYVIGWAALGTNHLKRGDLVEAEAAYLKARALQPEAWQVMLLLGNLARAKGDVEAARGWYMQAESRSGGSGEIAYLLAITEAMAGNRDAGLTWLETSIRRGYAAPAALQEDRQLQPLWDDPRFNELLLRYHR